MDEPTRPDGLDGVLEGGPPPSLDDLRGVLHRHRRAQLRMIAAGLGAAVMLAAGAGYIAGHSGLGGGTTQVTQNQPASAPNASGAAASATGSGAADGTGGGVSSAVPSTRPETQLLVRNADDGVRIRLYDQGLATNQPAASCSPVGMLNAEVSDDQVAGAARNLLWTEPKVAALETDLAEVVGLGEAQPILAVVAHTGTGVTDVTLTTPSGTDHAAPVSGWVALAVQLPSTTTAVPGGTLTATSADGTTVATSALTALGPTKLPPCQASGSICMTQVTSSGSQTAGVSGSTGSTVNVTCQCAKIMAGQAAEAGAGGPSGVAGGSASGGAASGSVTCASITSGGTVKVEPGTTSTTAAAPATTTAAPPASTSSSTTAAP